MANLFILLPLVNPGFISLIPYGASLASKVLFGRLPLLQFLATSEPVRREDVGHLKS